MKNVKKLFRCILMPALMVSQAPLKAPATIVKDMVDENIKDKSVNIFDSKYECKISYQGVYVSIIGIKSSAFVAKSDNSKAPQE